MYVLEHYVDFETAKLLKEKGFNMSIRTFYDIEKKEIGDEAPWNWNISALRYSCPTTHFALKWLREEHNIHPNIVCDDFGEDEEVLYRIEGILRGGKNHKWFNYENKGAFLTYERAAGSVLKYCLENLDYLTTAEYGD